MYASFEEAKENVSTAMTQFVGNCIAGATVLQGIVEVPWRCISEIRPNVSSKVAHQS